MAVEVEGSPTWGYYSDWDIPTITVPVPGGVQVGEYLICVIRGQNAGDYYTATGWTVVPLPTPFPGGARTTTVLYRRITTLTGLPSSVTFTRGSGGGRLIGTMIRVSGMSETQPVQVVSDWTTQTTTTTFSYPEFATTPRIGSVALSLAGGEFTAGNVSTVASFPGRTLIGRSETSEGASESRTALALHHAPGEATPVPGGVLTWDGICAAGAGLQIVLRSATGGGGGGDYPIYGTVTVQGAPVVVAGGGTSVTVPRPENIQAGETLLAVIRGQNTDGTDHFAADGWTSAEMNGSPRSGTRTMTVLYRFVDVPEFVPASFTFAKAGGGRSVAAVMRLRGAHHTNPVRDVSTYAANFEHVVSYAPFNYPLETGALALTALGAEFNAEAAVGVTGTPPSVTVVAQGLSGSDTSVARTALYLYRGPTGQPFAGRDYTLASIPSAAGGFDFVVRSDDPEPIDVVSAAATVITAQGPRRAAVDVWNGSTLSKVSKVGAMRPGFSSVAAMLATPGFTWAHRGNSMAHAEMSMHAYTQSVYYGYGVLELSMGRTSDGVWVGTHDNTLSRVTGETGLAPINQMTWAQVQALTNITGSDGRPQPFMRWEELRDTYGQTHVLVLDPKNYSWGSHRTEFLAMCQELDPSRVIVKQIGVGDGLADAATALGFHAWGHNLEQQIDNPDLPTILEQWTLLGVDLLAPQSTWDVLLATGKPVIGHIAASQLQYDLAMSKGAAGVQCGATHLIRAVGPA